MRPYALSAAIGPQLGGSRTADSSHLLPSSALVYSRFSCSLQARLGVSSGYIAPYTNEKARVCVRCSRLRRRGPPPQPMGSIQIVEARTFSYAPISLARPGLDAASEASIELYVAGFGGRRADNRRQDGQARNNQNSLDHDGHLICCR